MILYDPYCWKYELIAIGLYTVTFCVIFQFLTLLNTIFVARAVGAGAALRYGSGSDQMMRLLAAPAPQHCFKSKFFLKKFREEIWPKIYLGQDPDPDVFEVRIRIRSKIVYKDQDPELDPTKKVWV
jgi:hypothetical protein